MRNNICDDKVGEIRWLVIKAMLDEFPTLKERAKNYLREEVASPKLKEDYE